MPFEAIHETCLEDVVLHPEMEFPTYKHNSLVLRYHHGLSLRLGQHVHLRLLMSGLNASLL